MSYLYQSSADEHKSVIDAMKFNFDYSESKHPLVGTFWYDTKSKDLFGVNSSDPEDLKYYNAPTMKDKIKTSKKLHKDIWIKEQYRNKDKRFQGDYTKVPRGRIFKFQSNGEFRVYVGNWIKDFPEAKQDIIDEFELPSDVKFVIDEHWDLGHGWSDELI